MTRWFDLCDDRQMDQCMCWLVMAARIKFVIDGVVLLQTVLRTNYTWTWVLVNIIRIKFI
jgi:hypothetical protein